MKRIRSKPSVHVPDPRGVSKYSKSVHRVAGNAGWDMTRIDTCMSSGPLVHVLYSYVRYILLQRPATPTLGPVHQGDLASVPFLCSTSPCPPWVDAEPSCHPSNPGRLRKQLINSIGAHRTVNWTWKSLTARA